MVQCSETIKQVCLYPSFLRISDPFAVAETTRALKVVDFSHSLDLTLHPKVNPLKSFPIAQTKNGQQLLDEKSPPYQVQMSSLWDKY